jgi:pimeloyl-ACP methyl ester carboxylesterase
VLKRSGHFEQAVIIVHGLWVSGHAMLVLRTRLERKGYRALSFSYHSVHDDLSRNAARLFDFAEQVAASRVHFVGHSLGGLLIMQMLHEYRDARFGRAVLAGSPYRGCHAAKSLSQFAFGKNMLGRSIEQWFAQARPDIAQHYEIGVISGDRSLGLGLLIPGLPAPNDGTIAVAETQVPGAADQLLLHVSHSEMLISAQVAEQIHEFLQHGRFTRSAAKDQHA